MDPDTAPPIFIDPNAVCESQSIGPGTRVWAFVKILRGAVIGSDCNICHGCFIEESVVIGNRVTIKNHVSLWNGITIEDDVFIGPSVTFTNDMYPRSNRQFDMLETIVERGASIGANATILPGIRIGEGSMVGAGSLVVSDVPSRSLVVGNPARVIRSQLNW